MSFWNAEIESSDIGVSKGLTVSCRSLGIGGSWYHNAAFTPIIHSKMTVYEAFFMRNSCMLTTTLPRGDWCSKSRKAS